MIRSFRFLILCLTLLTTSICVQAQITADTRDGRSSKEEIPSNVQEMLAKNRIEQNKKDHDELIARGRDALSLSEQLERSFKQNKKFSKSDLQRLDQLEKLLKKIRKELGGEDDDGSVDEKKPSNLGDAVRFLRANTINLFDSLQQTTRYTISASAIHSSNTVLRIVKILRFWKH